MTAPDVIESTGNERLKRIRRLRRTRARRELGTFVVEGYREVCRAVAGGVVLEELFVAPTSYLGTNEASLVEAVGDHTKVITLGGDAFASITTRDRPDGVLAVARQFPCGLGIQRATGAGMHLVVEGVERPGNLGTMLRTACAAGVSGVIVCDAMTDIFHPEVVRASTGALFLLPVTSVTSTEAIAWIRRRSVRVIAGSPSGSSPYWAQDLTAPTAVVVGSEQYGLSAQWLDAADAVVSIPMSGGVDSLNLAAATSILLFEGVRQRAEAS